MVLQARSSDTGAHNNDGSARLEAMRHLIDSKDEEIECLRQRLAAVLGGGSRLADPSMRVNGGGEVACPRTRCSDPEAEKLRVRVDALTAAHAAQALELKRAEERAAAAEVFMLVQGCVLWTSCHIFSREATSITWHLQHQPTQSSTSDLQTGCISMLSMYLCVTRTSTGIVNPSPTSA